MIHCTPEIVVPEIELVILDSPLDVWTESSFLIIWNNENTSDAPVHRLQSFFLSGFSQLLSPSEKTTSNPFLDLPFLCSSWLMFLVVGLSSFPSNLSTLLSPPLLFHPLSENQTLCKVSLPWARIWCNLPTMYLDTGLYGLGITGLKAGLWWGRIVRWLILDTEVFCLVWKKLLAPPMSMSEQSTSHLLGDVQVAQPVLLAGGVQNTSFQVSATTLGYCLFHLVLGTTMQLCLCGTLSVDLHPRTWTFFWGMAGRQWSEVGAGTGQSLIYSLHKHTHRPPTHSEKKNEQRVNAFTNYAQCHEIIWMHWESSSN